MTSSLTLRSERSPALLQNLEEESIALFHRLKAASVPGPWDPSPVEDKYLRLRETLLTTPGLLPGFRHTFLAAGRHNFPDSPSKTAYLDWGGGIPIQTRWKGALHLLKMAWTLYRHKPFQLTELHSNLVGQPMTYNVPASWRSLIGSDTSRVHITEAQLRYVYYRQQLVSALGYSVPTLLEIGGGYGGLAAELLQRVQIGRYYLVELPETVPLAYFYLRASFDCSVQALSIPEDTVDPSARIVILPAWKLPSVVEPMTLLINTMSFQHMMPESVRFYLSQADRLQTRFLYLVNRDSKRDPTDLPITQYPLPDSYRIASRRKWLFGPQLEILFERIPQMTSQTHSTKSGLPTEVLT
jgi:hypothetical protein